MHGGLRYLEQFNFALVREALRERALLLDRLAPHLVTPAAVPLPARAPRLGAPVRRRRAHALRHPRRAAALGAAAQPPEQVRCAQAFPSLRADTLAGAIRYHDAQVDDARHTLELARTAASHGASLVSGARVTEIARDGDRVVGARVLDAMTGEEHDVPARVVVNATGVWAGLTEQLAGVENPIRMRPSKGVHLIVPRDRIDASVALITKTPTSVLFVLPWGRSWVIGTTDTTWHHGLSHPSATHADLAYLLDRPTPRSPRTSTSPTSSACTPACARWSTPRGSRSRRSRASTPCARPLPGLVTIAGGKYTTYRVMAEDAVDRCRDDLGDIPASTTADVPLIGAAEPEDVLREARSHVAGASTSTTSTSTGWRTATAACSPSCSTSWPTTPRSRGRCPAAPAPWPSRSCTRRATRARCTSRTCSRDVPGSTSRRATAASSPRGTPRHSWADVLGWDDATRSREVSRYQQRVAAELEAQAAPDDDAASAIRERVQDPRLPA